MNEVLRIRNLVQAFKGATVLNDISLSLLSRERLVVLGPSGSGKTTLLRLIAGLEAPRSGAIDIMGGAASLAGKVLTPPERRGVAFVFQGLALFPHLNALEQIAFAAQGRGGVDRARQLLESIGLSRRADAPLDKLSGGERQRIALARALAQAPRLLLMDEPFASLDDEKRAEMRHLLRTLLAASDTTLILVTHSREDALDLAQRVLILEDGAAVVDENLASALASPKHSATVRALGLGQIIDVSPTSPGAFDSVFGRVRANREVGYGGIRLLVRPGQPRFVAEPAGVVGEVVEIEWRPSETREPRQVAVVRVGGSRLRVLVRDQTVFVGQAVRLEIAGECEALRG